VVSVDPEALREDIADLGCLIGKARLLEAREVESKLVRLKELITQGGFFADADLPAGRQVKLLIFTEHKDTLDYLAGDGHDGRPLGRLREWGLNVTQIHGGMKIGDRDTPGSRIYAEREFRESCQVLVATEAAGEGINLQFCWYMINYDIPWNPNRLEQRMGRIHRYGQERDCYVQNFLASNTREGRVFEKLFERIEQIEADMDPNRTGKVFNVLGEVFPANQIERWLREMYAHNQMTEELIKSRIVEQVDTERLRRITECTLEGLARRSLNLSAIVGKSEVAKERRLVPEVIEDFFVGAAPLSGVAPRAAQRGSHVYRVGRLPRSLMPIGEELEPRFGKLGREYQQIVFDKNLLAQDATLEWVTPGHPLFECVRTFVERNVSGDLMNGAVFYDLQAQSPYHLDVFSAEVRDGRGNVLHKRLFVMESGKDGTLTVRQPTVFLDLSLAPRETILPAGLPVPDREPLEAALYTQALVPLLDEIRSQREGEIARITVHMEMSLNTLIDRVQRQFAALMEQKEAKSEESGLEGRIRICDDRLEELNNRLEMRRADLLQERECAVSNIQHLGAAWVLPHPDRDTPSIKPMVSDPAIEKIAVDAVIAYEEARGWRVQSVETENRGFDLISRRVVLPGCEGRFYVYAILCEGDSVYIGQTDDLDRRWTEHLMGQGAEWTKHHKPVQVIHYEECLNRESAVAMEKEWKSGCRREWLRGMARDRRLPAGRQVEVRFIEVKGRAGIGEIALTTNEYKTAERLRDDYWLYVVTQCLPTGQAAATQPHVHPIQDPTQYEWKPVVRVEHYALNAPAMLRREHE
jgi:predicted GIY-YIG superfamily endonuclease